MVERGGGVRVTREYAVVEFVVGADGLGRWDVKHSYMDRESAETARNVLQTAWPKWKYEVVARDVTEWRVVT